MLFHLTRFVQPRNLLVDVLSAIRHLVRFVPCFDISDNTVDTFLFGIGLTTDAKDVLFGRDRNLDVLFALRLVVIAVIAAVMHEPTERSRRFFRIVNGLQRIRFVKRSARFVDELHVLVFRHVRIVLRIPLVEPRRKTAIFAELHILIVAVAMLCRRDRCVLAFSGNIVLLVVMHNPLIEFRYVRPGSHDMERNDHIDPILLHCPLGHRVIRCYEHAADILIPLA